VHARARALALSVHGGVKSFERAHVATIKPSGRMDGARYRETPRKSETGACRPAGSAGGAGISNAHKRAWRGGKHMLQLRPRQPLGR